MFKPNLMAGTHFDYVFDLILYITVGLEKSSNSIQSQRQRKKS